MITDPASYRSPFGLERDMGFSRREFFNLLPKPLAEYDAVIGKDGANIKLATGSIRIVVGEERERRLSDLVRLPILPVEIIFDNVGADDQARFLRKFDLSYMKGLG